MVGFLGAAAMAAGASLPASPFVLDRSGAWFFGSETIGPQTLVNPVASLLGLLGFVLLSLAWFDLLAQLRRSPGHRPVELLPLALAWVVPFLVVAPQLSHDVYAYAAQGELFATGRNPTVVGAVALGPGAFRRLVDPIWLTTPSPYGPAFTWLEGATVVLAAHRVLWSVVLLRGEALAGVALVAVSLPSIARSLGRDEASAVALGAMSPLVLLDVVSPAHNDALMVGLVALALALALRGHPLAAIVVAGLGAGIKAPALGATLFVGWTWPAAGAPRWQRAGSALGGLVIGGGVLEVVTALTGAGWHWVTALPSSGKIWNFFTPDDTATTLVRQLGHVLGTTPPFGATLTTVHLVGYGVAIVVSAVLLWRAERLGVAVALGGAFLAVALAAPAFHAWYLTWGIALLAPAAGPRGTFWLAWLATVGAFLWLPAPRSATHALLIAALVAVVTCAVLLLRRLHTGAAGPPRPRVRGVTSRRLPRERGRSVGSPVADDGS